MSGFTSDRRGSTLVTFALTAFVLLAAVGGAIDFSMFVLERSKVQDGLDQAALVAAISPSTDKDALQKLANSTFAQNIDNQTINATIKDFKFDTDARTFQLTATGYYSPYLLHLVGLDSLPYTVNSKTVRAADGTLEVALVLDNTYSMSVPLDGTQTKLQVLQTASQNLVNTMLTSTNKDFVKVSIVPYAQYINVGMANRSQSWMSVAADNVTTKTTTTPAQCTTVSTKTTCTGGTQGTCTGYRDGVPYGYSCWLVAQTCTTVNITPVTTCTPEKTTTSTTTSKWFGCINNLMKSSALVMPDPTSPYVGRMESSSSCLAAIQPLTNDTTVLTATIKSLKTSTSSQETYIPGGLIWGVNVLSPPTPFTDGAAYDTANKTPRKTIVLMTDGANTAYSNSSGGVALANATQLATTYADEGKVCAYAKTKNIEIYTIGFGVTDATALANLKSCATDAAHYFDAKSSADLIAAFQTIGGKLTRVRITQ